VNRLWSRVSVRVTAVALLVLGIVGGVYIGQGRAVEQQRSAEPQLVVQADTTANEMQLLKTRQNDHAADRAWQRVAENNAAAKAAAEAKAAAARAHKLEKAAIAKKVKEQKAKEDAEKKSSESKPGSEYTGDIPASCDEFSGNRAIGCAMMLDAGFKIDQFGCLNKLWNRESGWNVKAYNASSDAYGIAQATPGSKMESVGSDWRTSAKTQIEWGLAYIKGRYDKPCGAWAKSERSGWY